MDTNNHKLKILYKYKKANIPVPHGESDPNFPWEKFPFGQQSVKTNTNTKFKFRTPAFSLIAPSLTVLSWALKSNYLSVSFADEGPEIFFFLFFF